jgi:hypothetical protein
MQNPVTIANKNLNCLQLLASIVCLQKGPLIIYVTSLCVEFIITLEYIKTLNSIEVSSSSAVMR